MKKGLLIFMTVMAIATAGAIYTETKIVDIEDLEISDLYERYDRPEYITGFNFIGIGFNKAMVTPEYIKLKEIKVAKIDYETDEDVLRELLTYSKNFKYSVDQPFPYEKDILLKGGNCQALSIWLSKQLTHYGLTNSLYLDEGNTHMYNIVEVNGQTVRVDLSTREVKYGKGV